MNPLILAILTTRPIEDLLGWLMRNNRGHDAGLTTHSPTIASAPKRIALSSPDVGAAGSLMSPAYASRLIGGDERMPSLTWTVDDADAARIKEYVLVCEDPDAPVPEPIVHGIYAGIDGARTGVVPADFEVEDEDARRLKGGFSYGRSRTGAVYIFPRPIMQHGEHRYIWSILGLDRKVDWEEVRRRAGEAGIGRSEVLETVEGKIVAWGEWYATYGRGR